MNTVTNLSQSLHQLHADAVYTWGSEDHTAHWDDNLLTRCENCDGLPANVDYCWQAQLQQLVISPNGPGFMKETT